MVVIKSQALSYNIQREIGKATQDSVKSLTSHRIWRLRMTDDIGECKHSSFISSPTFMTHHVLGNLKQILLQ